MLDSQRHACVHTTILFYLFDLLMLNGRDLLGETLVARRKLLEGHVLSGLADPIRYSPELPARLADLIQSVKALGIEGLVAKRRDSRYEPGQRSGAWRKMRINGGQEFVIGGYTVGGTTFDALIFGHYTDEGLVYVARQFRVAKSTPGCSHVPISVSDIGSV